MKNLKSLLAIILITTGVLFAQKPVVKKQIKKNSIKKNAIKTSVSGINTTPKRDSANFGKLKIKVYDQKSNAYFPKGDMELFSLIAHELKYTTADIEKKVDGRVLLRFDVDADSTVKEVRVIRDPCIDCGKDIVKIFEKLKFVPATTSNGTFVRTNMMMEIPVWAH